MENNSIDFAASSKSKKQDFRDPWPLPDYKLRCMNLVLWCQSLTVNLLIKAQHTEIRSSDWLSVCTERPYINKLYDDCEQQLRPRYFSTKFKADIFYQNLSVMSCCQDETTFKRRKTIRVKGDFFTHLGWTNYLN